MTKLDPAVEKKIEKLEKEREILLDALAFYASWETYFGILFVPDPPCGDFIRDFSFVEGDYGSRRRPGRRAREAADKLGLELSYEDEEFQGIDNQISSGPIDADTGKPCPPK